MPRKSKAQVEAEKAAAEFAARPFSGPTREFPQDPESSDPYAGRDDAGKLAVAQAIAADKAAGLSGNELRARYGQRLTGPARRKVLRAHSLDSTATIARSYDAYRDGESRQGTRHAREHGAEAAAKRAQAREEAAAELLAAQASRKGRSKADKEAYAARVAAAEARVASLA